MTEQPIDEPQRLRDLARELRERAPNSVLPGYAEERIRAAEALEKHAAELEAFLQQLK